MAINRLFEVGTLLGASCLRAGRRRPHSRTEERPPWHGPRRLSVGSTCVDCFQCSLTAVCECDGSPVSSQGPWLVGRHPIRPVLKHGPRSLTCARVTGWQTHGRNESEGRLASAQVGSLARGSGPTTGPSRSLVDEAEQERTRWDPKDGELCLSRTKPEETLVEVRSDSDVQIDRQTWV